MTPKEKKAGRRMSDAEVSGASAGTVFVAKQKREEGGVVCGAAEKLGLEARRVASIDDVNTHYDPVHPACIVADLAAVSHSTLELPEEVIESQPDCAVMIASAHILRDLEFALRSGAVTFLRLPCNPEKLGEAIRRAVAKDAMLQRRELQMQEIQDRVAKLTARERQVMDMIYNGNANKVIAGRLGVSLRTIEKIRQHVFEVMGADTAVDLVRILSSADYHAGEE
jgi:FixJ family two-component response regulator